jgi:hypothetical protein
MRRKSDPNLTALGAIVLGLASVVWSGGSFFRSFGDPGPSVPATVVTTGIGPGSRGGRTGQVVFEYTPPGASRTTQSVGVPIAVAERYQPGQSTRLFLRSFLGTERATPQEALAATRHEESFFSGLFVAGGLAAMVAGIVVLRRRGTRLL